MGTVCAREEHRMRLGQRCQSRSARWNISILLLASGLGVLGPAIAVSSDDNFPKGARKESQRGSPPAAARANSAPQSVADPVDSAAEGQNSRRFNLSSGSSAQEAGRAVIFHS